MAKLPEKTRQIAQVHAQLIHSVVMTCHNQALMPQLEPILKSAEDNGWLALIDRIRKILAGSRNTNLLIGLDEEDAAITLAILIGLQDPSQLPGAVAASDAGYAAPGLAVMIHAAAKGDVRALSSLGDMVQQMSIAPGSMRQMGAIIKPLISGERNLKTLTANMDDQRVRLVENLLTELEKLESA